MMLRFLPKRTLLVALVVTALIGGVYYAWSPPSKRHQDIKTSKFEAEETNLVKSDLKPEVLTKSKLENVSSIFIPDEPEILEAEQVCRPLPLKEATMETSDIYPKLNFNVSKFNPLKPNLTFNI